MTTVYEIPLSFDLWSLDNAAGSKELAAWSLPWGEDTWAGLGAEGFFCNGGCGLRGCCGGEGRREEESWDESCWDGVATGGRRGSLRCFL